MALNIKDPETEQLAARIAALTGASKTGAIREALRARLEQLEAADSVEERVARLTRFLEEEIWPQVPADLRGRRITKDEREEMLGYGPDGV